MTNTNWQIFYDGTTSADEVWKILITNTHGPQPYMGWYLNSDSKIQSCKFDCTPLITPSEALERLKGNADEFKPGEEVEAKIHKAGWATETFFIYIGRTQAGNPVVECVRATKEFEHAVGSITTAIEIRRPVKTVTMEDELKEILKEIALAHQSGYDVKGFDNIMDWHTRHSQGKEVTDREIKQYFSNLKEGMFDSVIATVRHFLKGGNT